MNKKTQEAFYWGAATKLDLESDEVDRILMAEGLDTRTHSARECREAVERNVRWTPAGPIVDWDSVKERIERIRQN